MYTATDCLFVNRMRALREKDKNENAFIEFIDNTVKRMRFLSPLNAALFGLGKPGSKTYALFDRHLYDFGLQGDPLKIPVPGLMPSAPTEPMWDLNDTVPRAPSLVETLIREEIPPFEFVPEERDPESVLFRLLACPHRFGIDAKPLSIPMYAGDAQRDDCGVRVVPRRDGMENHYNLNFQVRWNKNLDPVGQCEMVLHGFAHVLLGHLGPLACYKSDQKWGEADVNRVKLPDIMKEFEAETVTYMVERALGIRDSSADFYHDYVLQESYTNPNWITGFSIMRICVCVKKLVDLVSKFNCDYPSAVCSQHPRGTKPSKKPLPDFTVTDRHERLRDDCINYLTFEKQRRFAIPLEQRS
ncbi:hypothetical protein [Corynebacterium glucuronolyticum]|uniref:IrrE N-terminal-like domain-containing protein n=2 Tax=Corynebacterium glucuronolyticum TaxID=39791 RepID=A0AAX1L7L4_9CORY|nr:hypothetical protein [Corynebacterium glucuronolyticum]EEI26141.1 hypothetical protein HMPREF0294_2357 [Corynebacterium glucuronolyticum ATCC 51867]EEI64387.1 hypothetical protein HMPREF0293_0105 [Corynebacterium glucuronolyticum ATCC 51866]QRO82380.1 hypothetical protein I6J20_11170 [Corynebacterium glucuronolyticum]QRP70401.1 hypothetical protein I6J21_11715 [Corynebacterium glucuronolyticum]